MYNTDMTTKTKNIIKHLTRSFKKSDYDKSKIIQFPVNSGKPAKRGYTYRPNGKL